MPRGLHRERESLRSQCSRFLSQRDKAEKDLADYRVRAKAEQQALEDEVQILITDKTKLEEQLRDLTKKVEKLKGFKVLYSNATRPRLHGKKY